MTGIYNMFFCGMIARICILGIPRYLFEATVYKVNSVFQYIFIGR